MRFVRTVIVLALILSVVGNVVLYYKTGKMRTQLTVNGQRITQKDYHDYLEQHFGEMSTAQMVKRELIMQAAQKANLAPSESEIKELMEEYKEQKPMDAALMKIQTWKETDLRQAIETELALQNLTGKEVKVTDEDLKDFFNAAPDRWDKPTKIYTRAIQCFDPQTTERAEQLLTELSPDQRWKNLSVLRDRLAPKAELFAGEGKWVLRKPFSGPSPDAIINELAAMKPGDIKKVAIPNSTRTLIIVMEKVELGKKVTLEEVKAKVERAYKRTRAVPAQEYLRTLWDAAEIHTDPEGMKASIERLILPERAQQALAAGSE